jgi:hypothetical protein
MGAAAGFHADQAARQVGEELQQSLARQPLAQHRSAASVDAVKLKDVPPGPALPARGHALRDRGRSS